MGLVDHHDDVLAVVEHAGRLAELVDSRDDHLASVGRQEPLKLGPLWNGDHVGYVGSVEGGGDLGVEVDAVDDDHDRGITELGV